MGAMDTMMFVKIILGISAGAFLVSFWLLMLKDCINNMEGYDRYQWCLIIAIGNVFGAAAYYLFPRRKRINEELS